MIEVENLSKRYGEKLAADGLDFVVRPRSRRTTSSASGSLATATAKSRSLVKRGTERTDIARPPISAHRTPSKSRSATARRSSCSTGVATALSRRQTQPRVRWRGGQPGPHEAINLPAAGVRVLTPHPLPVELHPQIVHIQCRAQPLGLRSPSKRASPSASPQPSGPRDQHPDPPCRSCFPDSCESSPQRRQDRQHGTTPGAHGCLCVCAIAGCAKRGCTARLITATTGATTKWARTIYPISRSRA
jgi:hypothetical protein